METGSTNSLLQIIISCFFFSIINSVRTTYFSRVIISLFRLIRNNLSIFKLIIHQSCYFEKCNRSVSVHDAWILRHKNKICLRVYSAERVCSNIEEFVLETLENYIFTFAEFYGEDLHILI